MKKFSSKKDIRVGVIGYGGAFNMGKNHLHEMREAGMTPVAVCELDSERLKVARDDFEGIETYRTTNQMLKKSDVNLITIITPHNTHARLAIKCLEAGRHVVTEKPFAITVAECDAMMSAARRRGLTLSTYHNRHWDGCVLEGVDQIVNRKVIGDVVSIDIRAGSYGKPGDWWRSSKSISGGLAYDWGVHFLEYALQIMNENMLEVTGVSRTGVWAPKTRWKDDTNEDAVSALVRFANQKWLTLSMSSLEANPKPGFIEVHGTKGTYVMDHGTYEIIQTKGNGRVTRTSGNNRQGVWGEFYKNIADHMTRGKKLIITPEWARRPIQVLDMANQSAKLGKAMKLKYR